MHIDFEILNPDPMLKNRLVWSPKQNVGFIKVIQAALSYLQHRNFTPKN